jgi:hypothetical protein
MIAIYDIIRISFIIGHIKWVSLCTLYLSNLLMKNLSISMFYCVVCCVWLGLGAMGGNMAINLVKKYPNLQVFDIVEDNVKRVLEAGPTATG